VQRGGSWRGGRAAAAPLQPGHPGLPLPPLRAPHQRPGEHPGPELPPPARALLRLLRPHRGALSVGGGGTALLSVLVVWRFGVGWETAAALLLTWGLIALAVIDLDTQLLPDALTLPLLWLGLLLSLTGWFTDPQAAILGAAAGYASLWLVFQLFRLATGKEGMGFGDFKLFALFGAWLGWQHLPQIILLSACTGAVLGVLLILARGRDRQAPLPFGPFLAAAGWLSLMWGDAINQAYLQWTGLG
jgi:leader peptidase (prepilin peptidase) / N-methyltransferase